MNVKVTVLSPIVGDGFSYPVSKKQIAMAVDMAFKLAGAGVVSFVDQAEYQKMLDAQKIIEDKVAEDKAESESIMKKEQLEAELNGLYNDVVLKEAELNGVVLNGEQILEMVEELKKRILPVGGAE